MGPGLLKFSCGFECNLVWPRRRTGAGPAFAPGPNRSATFGGALLSAVRRARRCAPPQRAPSRQSGTRGVVGVLAV